MADAQQPPSSTPPNSLPVGTIILLVLAGLLYVLMMANLSDSAGSDAAGRGMAQAFAALVGVVLWIVLAILLIVAGVKGRMPPWAAIAAIVLLPLSAVAAVTALDLHNKQGGWFLVVTGLLPPLIALYALWARLPQLHARFPAIATSAIVGGAILVLSLVPIAASIIGSLPDPQRDARIAEEARQWREKEQREAQEWRAREEAKFAALSPDSSLKDYLDYLKGSGPRSREALQGIKQVKSRQADAVALLQKKPLVDLADLWQYNLEPTPELCQAYGAALGGAASQVSKTARSDYINAAIDMEWQLPNIRWLVGTHCDLGQPLGLLEANVRAVADSSRMTKFADTLAELRKQY